MRFRRPKAEEPEIVPVFVRASGKRGEVIAFGDRDALERIGSRLDRVPGPVVRGARTMLAAAASFADTAEQFDGAWLKLTPQARRLLDTHQAITTGEGMIGLVRDVGGKFAGQLTFVEPQTVGALANAPALAAAAALQLQMVAIEQRLEVIHRDLGYLIGDVHLDLEAELAANLDILDHVFAQVRQAGELSESEWDRVVSVEASVRRLHHRSSGHLRQLEEALSDEIGGIGDRVKQLKQAIQNDHTDLWLDVHVHAEKALTQWQALYMLRQIDEHPERAAEFAGALKAEVTIRFDALVQLATAIATALDMGHDHSWTDRFRIISKARLRHLLAELEQILAGFHDGVEVVRLAGDSTGALESDRFTVGSWTTVASLVGAPDTRVLERVRQAGTGLGRRALVRVGATLEQIRPSKDGSTGEAPPIGP